jgi:hypothetical protein
METLAVVVFVAMAIVILYLWHRGELVGSLDGDFRTAFNFRGKATISVKRVGRDSGPPTVQLHLQAPNPRGILMNAQEAAQLATMLEAAASSSLGESLGRVKGIEVTIMEGEGGGPLPALTFRDDEGDVHVVLWASDARQLSEWLRLAAMPGRTLRVVKAIARKKDPASRIPGLH